MSLVKTFDGHRHATAYVQWSLSSSAALSRQIASTADLDRGTFVAYVPPGRLVSEFRFGGGSKVSECIDEIVRVCAEFLVNPGAVAVFEHHLVSPADPRDYLIGRRMLTGDSVVQVALPDFDLRELTLIVRDWHVGPIFNAFLFQIGTTMADDLRRAPLDAPLEVSLISPAIRQVICGAYDDEGFVLWKAPAA